ncbi:MAG: hypothetical protein R3310_17485, partial [Candidatus Competibacteraceae bacterium]|nr:hypothetical protein [Candidatus Competibacteraceae bacterium]
ERTGRTFRLGDPLRVKVVRVDLDERKIDFEPVEEYRPKGRGAKGTKGGRSGKGGAGGPLRRRRKKDREQP